MIDLRSINDGFNVILCTWLIHLAAFLTLLGAISRPPEYENDEERTRKAKWIFGLLVAGHFVYGIIKWLSLHYTNFFDDKKEIGVILLVVMVIHLC